MWYIRSKNKRKATPFRDALAKKIAGMIISVQLWIVKRLQAGERRCTLTQKKILFVVFCLAFGGYCLFLLGNTIYRSITPAAQSPPARQLKDSVYHKQPLKKR